MLNLKRQLANQIQQSAGDKRLIRNLRAHEQKTAETHEASPDADGIGGRPAVVWMRDKNLPSLGDQIQAGPFYPYLGRPGDPLAPTIGFHWSVPIYRDHVLSKLYALWVDPLDSAVKVRLKHRLGGYLSDGVVKLMLRDDTIGRAERFRVEELAIRLPFAFSTPYVFRSSQEVQVDPVEVDRRPQPGAPATAP